MSVDIVSQSSVELREQSPSNPPVSRPLDLRNGKVGGRPKLNGDESDPLTSKQELFVAEYLVDLNATQAAIRAGYSSATASSIASSLLSKLNVQAEIKKQYTVVYNSLGVKAQRVLAEIARLAFSDARELFDDDGRLLPIKRLPDSIAAAVSSVKVTKTINKRDDTEDEYVSEVKLWSKPSALNLLGKHFGLLRDVIEHTGSVDIQHSQGMPAEFKDLTLEDKRDMVAILERARARKMLAGSTEQAAIESASEARNDTASDQPVIDLMSVDLAETPVDNQQRAMIADLPWQLIGSSSSDQPSTDIDCYCWDEVD